MRVTSDSGWFLTIILFHTSQVTSLPPFSILCGSCVLSINGICYQRSVQSCSELNDAEKEESENYLDNFGYGKNPTQDTIKCFQKYAGVEPTGKFNRETLGVIKKPRCIRPDPPCEEKQEEEQEQTRQCLGSFIGGIKTLRSIINEVSKFWAFLDPRSHMSVKISFWRTRTLLT